jgi:hypothetical protein
MKLTNIFKTINKKIIFQSAKKHADLFLNVPEPSYKNIPFWYKQQKLFSNNENDFLKANKKAVLEENKFHYTYKTCTPLVDTLTSGYIIKTSADMLILNLGKETYEPEIQWNVSWNLADKQNDEVLGNYPVPHGYYPGLFRWTIDYKVITPTGYSLWITHPSHRHDLPFLTINGFVDTDKHPNHLVLPFFIQNNFEGIIPKGTPIAQIIPIKRDSWHHEHTKYNPDEDNYVSDYVKTSFIRAYKKKYWTKKEYK